MSKKLTSGRNKTSLNESVPGKSVGIKISHTSDVTKKSIIFYRQSASSTYRGFRQSTAVLFQSSSDRPVHKQLNLIVLHNNLSYQETQ